MGVSITANNSAYDFDMGYGGFFSLRKTVALALNKEFGENYALLGTCWTEEQFKENDKIADWYIKKNNLDKDVVDFLYQSDTNGKISYKTCGKIYDILKDKDLSDKGFRYGAYRHNDYEEFKDFLKECYSHRRNMEWY